MPSDPLARRYYALSFDLPLATPAVLDAERSRVDGLEAHVDVDADELRLSWLDAAGRTVEARVAPDDEGDAFTGRIERCREARCDRGRAELRPLWSGDQQISGYHRLAEFDDASWNQGRVLGLAESRARVALALGPVGWALVSVSRPEAPELSYQEATRDLDEWVNDVAMAEQRWLLVASSTRGLRVFDLDAGIEPVPVVDAFPGPRSNVHGLFLDGERLYLSRVGSFGGLDIVDLSEPARPRLLAALDVPDCEQVHATFARGSTLVLSCLDQGTFVFELSDSLELALVAHDDELGSHSAWLLDDGVTLLTTSERYEGALRVLRLDRPRGTLALVSTLTTDSAASAHDVSCSGRRCVVSHYQEGVLELDVTHPETPRRARRFPTWDRAATTFLEGASDAVLVGPRVYVADTTRGLLVLERERSEPE